jgi:hypothetical protein
MSLSTKGETTMKADLKLVIDIQMEVEDMAALEAAEIALGVLAHLLIDEGIDDGNIIDWDLDINSTVNNGEGVSLVNKGDKP